MIRERISTQGVVRPLEPDSEIPALQVPPDLVGTLSERAIRRWVESQERFDKKFASTKQRIKKHRERNLKRGTQDAFKRITQLQHYLEREREAITPPRPLTSVLENAQNKASHEEHKPGVREGLLNASASWSLAWALDADERPPPSSIVARRDTQEALELARVADMSVLAEESEWNANSLWTVVSNFLTMPDKDKAGESVKKGSSQSLREKPRNGSRFAPFMKARKDDETEQKDKAPVQTI